MKFYPRFNDAHLVQHADDQINDGTPIAGEPYEVEVIPIGNAIESYNGALTVETFIDRSGSSSPVDVGDLLYSERLVERLKIVEWTPLDRGIVKLTFRLRAAFGSGTFIDVPQFVYLAFHDACGESGGAPAEPS